MLQTFTHAGTSESVTLDDGCGRAELGRPPGPGQAPGAAADHQQVEAAHVCRRSRGHASPPPPRQECACAAREEVRPGAQHQQCHDQEACVRAHALGGRGTTCAHTRRGERRGVLPLLCHCEYATLENVQIL